MLDGFVSLEEFLAPAPAEEIAVDRAIPEPAPRALEPPEDDVFAETFAALAETRRFRAALADAVDAALADLLREIACGVLARELELAPADVLSIAGDALRRFAAENPLSVRAHPDEVAALAPLGIATIADPGLRRGDVVIELRAGTIDATLGARLESVLAPS
ncbi:MAG TPA: FliH/SctL family protein [Candidatus Tumulicola sp.]|jgi:flagellar biosynthesis/type III secretory pathway protein FliH